MSLEVNMKEPTKRPHPRYTLEFKKDAAKLVNEKGYTHPHAADNLGISLSAMGRWARVERVPTATPATKTAPLNLTDHSGLTRLRRENEQLRMGREILKKAAVFPSASLGTGFAKDVE
jgi:transposase